MSSACKQYQEAGAWGKLIRVVRMDIGVVCFVRV